MHHNAHTNPEILNAIFDKQVHDFGKEWLIWAYIVALEKGTFPKEICMLLERMEKDEYLQSLLEQLQTGGLVREEHVQGLLSEDSGSNVFVRVNPYL